ncbi:MAG: gamma-glutamylcyclotransferase [Gammaproteobacteria bacterium]|nr:gamma-glutamylcyclotransferase [Gammaproteobacteria bacterium]
MAKRTGLRAKLAGMRYLAYGSNLHPARLRARSPSARLLGKAVVAGHALRFHKRSIIDGSGKCSIAKADDSIHVAVYELSNSDGVLLDEAEGLGIGYRHQTIAVAEFGECITYVATETHVDDSLRPYTWYKELVLLGCASLQFPQDYIDSIETVASQEDPDRQRHEENMQIVHRMSNSKTDLI